MKKYNIFLSPLLIPALVLAGSNGGSGCSSGGGTPTPPTFSLPATINGTQVGTAISNSQLYIPGGVTSFSFTASNSASGTVPASGTYNVWCTNPNFNGDTSNVYAVYNSYAYSTYQTSALIATMDVGTVGSVTYNGNPTVTLTLTQAWNAVNWILNNPTGFTGHNYPSTINDIQGAIWELLHPDGIGLDINPALNPTVDVYAADLYYDAVQYGTGFVPGNGQLSALILVPQNPPATGVAPDQGIVLPVIVSGNGCTSTSGIYLLKQASVSSANAWQQITYGYYVANTGSTTLTNITVTDDNGTPAYSEDDFTVGTIASLAPGAYQFFFVNVYLPIHLFAQAGNNAIFDTLIPQVPPTTLASGSSIPAGSLVLTYLEDKDVFDNTYGPVGVTPPAGTGASAGWAAVGGHELWQDLGNYAEFQYFDSNGHLVSDFDADYLTFYNSTSQFPSEFGSSQLHGPMIYGSSSYVQYITSTLADNLNGYAKFYTPIPNGATSFSPDNDVNWQSIAGYKVQVSQSIFTSDKCRGGGFGSASVRKNYINYSELGSNLCYSPQTVGAKIVSTAWVSAFVCGCNTWINAKASVCVTLNGCGLPTNCGSFFPHKCAHQDECRCTCAKCQAGDHAHCTQPGCHDVRCSDEGCPNQCQCHCIKCEAGDHAHCVKTVCTDSICHKNGCQRPW